MMINPRREELLKKVDNCYELVNVIARRAKQIEAGDEPKVKTKETSVLTIAALEFIDGKYEMIKGEKK